MIETIQRIQQLATTNALVAIFYGLENGLYKLTATFTNTPQILLRF